MPLVKMVEYRDAVGVSHETNRFAERYRRPGDAQFVPK
jgi:hypothetical protein